MKVAIKKIKINRQTGKKIKEEILEIQEVEESYLDPLINICMEGFDEYFQRGRW